ncbi:MAG: hypothetical protein WCV73_02110 [Patescibacteria group bacterium]|jgi:hypothetical protein
MKNFEFKTNDDTSTTTKSDTLISESEIGGTLKFLNDQIVKLQDKANETAEDFNRLEGRTNVFSNFIMGLTSLVAGVFFISGIFIFLDYWKYNPERFEKFMDKTEEIKDNFYTKQEMDKNINNHYLTIKDQLNKAFGFEVDLDNQSQELGELRKSNEYLLKVINCQKDKRYWQFEQCYK